MCISQDNTDLRWSQTLSSVLDDLFNDIIRGQLEPSWRIPRVWSSGGGNTFTLIKLVFASKILSSYVKMGALGEIGAPFPNMSNLSAAYTSIKSGID